MSVYQWIIKGAARSGKTSQGAVLELKKQGIRLNGANWNEVADTLEQRGDGPRLQRGDFHRCDEKSRMYITGALGALRDAGVKAERGTAMLDCGREGCHRENLLYFRDYRNNAMHWGHGHLFVGTLPTTPLCEAAIALRLTGPGYYLDTLGEYEIVWAELEALVEETEPDGVLFFHYEQQELLTFYLERGNTRIEAGTTPEELFRAP